MADLQGQIAELWERRAELTPDDGDARIDAARARLRARIEPPDPDADRA